MKIVIPGGTGQVGNIPARVLQAAGHEVVVLDRQPRQDAMPWRVVSWDAETAGDPLADRARRDRRSDNIAAPNPLPNDAFMSVLREAQGVRFGLAATEWMSEIGARFLRTETELILKSRRVIPGRLLHEGFTFHFPT